MKIIYIANSRMPTEKAHGIQIVKMCESFAKHNVKVELIVPRRFNHIQDDPFVYYNVEKSFKITKVVCLDFTSWGILGFWLQRLSFLLAAKLYVRYKNYDFIYTRDEFCALLFRNVVLEMHSVPKKIRKLHYKIYQYVKQYIVLTSFIKKELEDKLDINTKNILVSPDGVDLKLFDIAMPKKEARSILHLPQDKKIICYSGKFKTMGMDKGINIILQSLTLLPKNNDIIFMAVGGSNDEIQEYKAKALQLNILDKVKFIGHIPQKKLAIYHKACDVLLMPFPYNKHYAYYMSPLKMFEYMASQRPIIASDLPSIREILHKDSAFFVRPDDPQGLTDKIQLILSRDHIVEKIAQNAFFMVQKLSWHKRVGNILHFINK